MTDYLLPLFVAGFVIAALNSGSLKSAGGVDCFTKFKDVSQPGDIPFALGSCDAIWPVISSNSRKLEVPYKKTDGFYADGNPARAFGAKRADGERYHVGIDLYCDDEDVCVACEDGTIVGVQGFLNITDALLLQTTSGIVCLYGEIEAESWKYFDLKVGSKVKKGQKIARIGKNQAGTQMLHFETYRKGTKKNERWEVGKKPGPNILNPTKYLLNIANRNKNS